MSCSGNCPTPAWDLEAWATLSAALRKRSTAARDAMLKRLDLDAFWPTVDRQCRDQLVDEIAEGNMEPAFHYTNLCGAAGSGVDDELGDDEQVVSAAASIRQIIEASDLAAPGPVGSPTAPEMPARPIPSPPVQVSPPAFVEPTNTTCERPNQAVKATPFPEPRDLLQKLAGGRGTRPGEKSAPSSRSGELFVDVLMPQGPEPRAPKADQLMTAPMGNDAAGPVRAVAKVAKWPVEKYAQYCAELEFSPNSLSDIRARFGIPSGAVHAAARKVWDQRLAADPKLQNRFHKALTHFRSDRG